MAQRLLILRIMPSDDVESFGVASYANNFAASRFDPIQFDIDCFPLEYEYVFDSSKSRILLVQSEPVLAELTKFRLELLGYQIELVGSGSEAAAEIEQTDCDLVIVDTALPEGDGIEWIAQTRSVHAADQLPIIVFSLDPSLETVERAFHAGANDYLITPFDPTVMEEKIEAILIGPNASARN